MKFSKPVLNVLRPIASVVVFALAASVMILAGPHEHVTSFSSANDHCYKLFIKGWQTDNAKGTYKCFSQNFREGLYGANGWNSDADIQTWMDNQFRHLDDGSFTYVVITEYSGNPVQRCEPAGGGQCMGDAAGNALMRTAYLIYLTPYYCDAPAFDGEHVNQTCGQQRDLYGGSLAVGFTILVEPDSTIEVE